jgi:hypothetical protein
MAFAVWCAIAAFLMVPTAHADPMDMDNQYLSMLDRDGISNRSGAASAIDGAHFICEQRMDGVSESSLISKVYQLSQLDQIKSAAMVHDAELAYCPGYYGGSSGAVA